MSPGEITQRISLLIEQVECRTDFEGHVGVGDSALEHEKLRHGLHVHRKLGDQIIVLKVEVLVAVRRLGRTTRFDGIDLRGDLVVGTETGCG